MDANDLNRFTIEMIEVRTIVNLVVLPISLGSLAVVIVNAMLTKQYKDHKKFILTMLIMVYLNSTIAS